jgi:predicted permease
MDLTLEWNIALDGPVLAFTLGVTLLTSLIFGLAPALRLSNPDLVSSLKGRFSSNQKKPNRPGRVLVGAQMAVSTVLLVCAGLFAKNLKNALAVDTGFRQDELVVTTLDPGLHGYDRGASQEIFASLLARVRATQGVQSVGLAKFLPLGIPGAQQLVEVPGHQPSRGESMNIHHNIVDSGYFSSLGIPLMEGRGFVESDGELGGTSAIVNRRFADRFWPGESPIGKAFEAGGRGWEVVGVVPTGKYQRLGEDPMAFMYFPWPNFQSGAMTIHVRTAAGPTTIFPLLRREVESIAPGLPLYDMKSMKDHLAFALLPARISATVLGIFGALCLVLLSVGIHGVVAYSVSRRTREVGIRVAMGAEPASATALVLGEEGRVVIIGVLLGLAGALAATRLLETLLYSRDGSDPTVFLGAPLLLAAVAGVASYLPARRAARVDPAKALREE